MKQQVKVLGILLGNFAKKNTKNTMNAMDGTDAKNEKECGKVTNRSASVGSAAANIKLLCLLMSFAPILLLATCASNNNSASNSSSSSSSAGGSTPPIPISAGGSHSCAIANGQALCWGSEGSGRLGNGATTGDQSSPIAVRALGVSGTADSGSTLTRVTDIAAGDSHSCAIANGQALCWGSGFLGRLGNGASTGDQTSPVAVRAVGGTADSTLTDVTAIATGRSHNCAIANGQALCWGSGGSGQLGNGVAAVQTSPVAVLAVGGDADSTLTGVTAIAIGGSHSCAITNGQAVCWGDGSSGQLGNADTDRQTSPVAVRAVGGASDSGSTLTGVTAIAAGAFHSCAIVANGQVVCWGSGTNGQLGNGATTGNQTSPVAVLAVGGASDSGSTLTGVTALAVKNAHSCAIVANGQAVCWGNGTNGRLGNGTTTGNQTSPVAVLAVGGASDSGSTLTGVTNIATGDTHSCATADGQVVCWGNGANGRLGNGATTNTTSPVAVGDFPSATQ